MDRKNDFKIFAKYVSLNIMSMIGLSFYILVDTYFISKGMGAEGLTALNLAIPVFSFISGTGLMLGIGGGTRYAVLKAQGQNRQCSRVFSNMIVLALVLSAVFVPAGIFASDNIADLLGADSLTLEMTSVYMKVILIFSPAFMINNILNSFVKNDGNPHLAMVAMVSGSLFNVVFDYIFIFMMHMGMMGAAVATGAAPVMGLFVLSFHFTSKKNSFHFNMEKPDMRIAERSMSLGLPAFVTEVSNGIVIIIFNLLILRIIGNTGVAAYGIITNISLVVISVYTGIAQGIQPVISDAYGRKMKSRINFVFFCSVCTVMIISALIYLGLSVETDAVISIFNKEQSAELAEIADKGIKLYFTAIPFAGFNIVMASYYASVEERMPAHFISIARGFAVIIPVVFIMADLMGITGIWLSFPASEIITSVIGIMLFTYFRKK